MLWPNFHALHVLYIIYPKSLSGEPLGNVFCWVVILKNFRQSWKEEGKVILSSGGLPLSIPLVARLVLLSRVKYTKSSLSWTRLRIHPTWFLQHKLQFGLGLFLFWKYFMGSFVPRIIELGIKYHTEHCIKLAKDGL